MPARPRPACPSQNGAGEAARDEADPARPDPGLPVPGRAAGAPRPCVLIVAHAFPPDTRSGAARAGRFARYLPEFGYDPVVICGGDPPGGGEARPAWVRHVPRPEPGRTTARAAELARLAQRYLAPYDDNLPWAVHAALEAEELAAGRPVAAVLSTSPPVGVHLAALWLKWRRGLPWVADFRDPIRGNPFRSRRWPFPYDRLLERLIFRHADALVANTDTVAGLWARSHPDVAGKVCTIWNGFDPEDWASASPLPARERRVLAHVGSLGAGRQPDALLASLVRLVGRGDLDADRILVHLAGPMVEGRLLVDPVVVDALRGRECLEYDGRRVSRSDARRIAAEADYLLLLDLNDGGADLQVPGKLFEYIQIGRPILAFTTRRGSPVARILQDSGVPHRVVYQGDADAEVDRQVFGLLAMPTEPVRPSPWFVEHFDGRNQARAVARLLDRVREPARPEVAVANVIGR